MNKSYLHNKSLLLRKERREITNIQMLSLASKS